MDYACARIESYMPARTRGSLEGPVKVVHEMRMLTREFNVEPTNAMAMCRVSADSAKSSQRACVHASLRLRSLLAPRSSVREILCRPSRSRTRFSVASAPRTTPRAVRLELKKVLSCLSLSRWWRWAAARAVALVYRCISLSSKAF